MAIPTFPSQDLAKLVLGYLNDEQLMTVYDEFLQASPYLDAQKNEYDRIFMKSLRGILNEYWGVKIFVEKCKPFALRKKLSQCNSLLEVVKYLISHVDLRKIPNISPQDKNGIWANKNLTQHSSLWDRECNTCRAIQNESCVCNKPVNNSEISRSQIEASSNMVEATSLTDLPGSTKRKQIKVLERDSSEAERLMTCDPSDSSPTKTFSYSSSVVNTETVAAPPGAIPEASLQYDHSIANKLKIPADNNQNNQELVEILNVVSNNGAVAHSEYRTKPESVTGRKISTATFQDFATGVQGGTHVDMSIPDSSTSETTGNLLPTMARENIPLSTHSTTSIAGRKTQYLIHVNSKNLALLETSAANSANSPADAKVSESKITILSDVKVDNNQVSRNRTPKMPPVLQNATSTPLMQMQTILINGTPAYKPNVHLKTRVFTEDEIMAMPTLFIVTAPGPPPMANTVKTTAPQTSGGVSVTSSTNVAPSLGPLTIDVDPESTKKPPGEIKNMPILNPPSDTGLVTMVDLKNASVPKDSTISKVNTPQCLPILRKSSSTPRRNSSHVRVLDFTTPRRILHETASENGENPVEIILSQSPSTHDQPMCINNIEKQSAPLTVASTSTDENSSKENTECPLSSKKNNWDADLRALCTQSKVDPIKPTPAKKKKSPEGLKAPVDNDKSTKKSKKKNLSSKPKTPKLKKTKKKLVSEEPVSTVPEVKVPVKPTFHIVTDSQAIEPEKTENKSSTNNQSDTPDMDRTSLQNIIGAKLNISDLLETPYKQALYDIQMETPKFLRPDIPLTDEPVSEIKISDIPTPRFFDTPGFGFTPKPGQPPTPSSYGSRPTDYSSGGSYYKPDDQDYAPHPDDLGFPIINTYSAGSEEKDYTAVTKDKSSDKPLRPVRQCTKNVSYTFSDSNRPVKHANFIASTDTSVSSMDASKDEVKYTVVTDKKEKPIKEKRKSTSKRRKSPVKKAIATFMKIKPRRPTPEKVTKRKSNISESSQCRKRTSSKEKASNTTPPVIPAPTKSRRKSSTPRKLHTKVLISPNPDSSESIKDTMKSVASSAQDSDTENVPLRWPDDDSQDANTKSNLSTVHEEEDISKIRDYIEKSRLDRSDADRSLEPVKEAGSLHKDLVLRGFDVETARSIERDLLDIPHSTHESSISESDNKETNKLTLTVKTNTQLEIEDKIQSDSSTNNRQKNQEEGEEEVDEIELSIYESNEEFNVNYFVSEHMESIERTDTVHHKLKDNFTMEFCIEEDFSVRLKTTALTFLLDKPGALDENVSIKETEEAVNSIPNYDRLYTPLKHNRQAPIDALIEVFDSSLTSLDTPLKADSPKNNETMISEIVLEVEQIVEKDDSKGKSNKRRRIQSDSCSDESSNEPKKKRREILPNIQNFDIESVLSKLHGP